jgi:hypothetical protein
LEQITIGQIAVAVAFIAALITGGVKIKDAVKKWLTSTLKESFDAQKKETDEIKKTVDDIKTQLATVDLENCKNYLVTFLAECERGEKKDEIETQRFYEEYSHYIDKGGNSYVKEKYAKLKQKGLL